MRSEGYGTWFVCLSVCQSVSLCACSLVFFDSVQQSSKIATLRSLGLHRLDFKNSDFREKYCVLKLWHENQANEPIYKWALAYLNQILPIGTHFFDGRAL